MTKNPDAIVLRCDCGETDTDELRMCFGCGHVSCDSCGGISWCHVDGDEPNGDYFCDGCVKENE